MITVPLSTFENWGIPLSAFHTEQIELDFVLCLSSPVYCQVFWTNMWYNYFSEMFADQKMIISLQSFDLQHPVYLNKNEQLVHLPPSLQSIVYYAEYKNGLTAKLQPFMVNSKIFPKAIVSLVIGLVLILLTVALVLYHDWRRTNKIVMFI